MPDKLLTKVGLNFATSIIVKIPKVQQWLLRPMLRIVEGVLALEDCGNDIYFTTFTVTNIGIHPVRIKGAFLETGYPIQGDSHGQIRKPPILSFPKYGISGDKLPCKLKPERSLTFHFETSDLVAHAREYGKNGHLAGFHFVCQDARGNSFTSQNWSFYETIRSTTSRGDPGHGYITPREYTKQNRRRIRRARVKLWMRSCKRLVHMK